MSGAGLAGLLIGIMLGGASGDSPAADDSTPVSKPQRLAGSPDPAVEQLEGQLDEAVAARNAAEDALAGSQAQTQELQSAVDQAEKAQRKAVAAAVRKTKGELAAQAPSTSSSGQSGGGTPGTSTDPPFGTCTEATSYGYGPYYAGTNAEYDWYDDRDNDGVVCE